MQLKKLFIATICAVLLIAFCSCKSVKTSDLETRLKKDGKFSPNSDITIECIYEKPEESLYFAIEKPSSAWAYSVHLITLEDDVITNIKPIESLGGNILNYKKCNINEKQYWQFDMANHQGNGKSLFFDVSERKVTYKINGTVDTHFEGNITPKMAKEQGFNFDKIADKSDEKFSVVYLGKHLESYVKDMNEDGYEDLVFYGTQLLIKEDGTKDYQNVFPNQNIYLERTYYYNSLTNQFTEKLS